MADEIRVAMIGLDTSHAVAFPKRMQDPECGEDLRVGGMRAVTCMRFETPFQDKDGLASRQAQIEKWGIHVTESFNEAVADCDAIMLEINDSSLHLDYFRKVAALGKPVFIDKPLADNTDNARAILELAQKHNTRVMSCSALRMDENLMSALTKVESPQFATTYGILGEAPSGDSLIWYGVHAFEMLHRILGGKAEKVTAHESETGIVTIVDYAGGRQGVVETRQNLRWSGGRIADHDSLETFQANGRTFYSQLLKHILAFFRGSVPNGSLEDAFEVLSLMCAARASVQKGRPV